MKKNIALLAGGYSGEYEISIMSGHEIAKYLNKDKYNVYLIVVNRTNWYYNDNNNCNHEIDKNDFSLKLNDLTIHFDAVFNMIHGIPGEDGKIQGYLDLMQIPYTGCNMYASAVTFNKFYCKSIVSSVGIPTANSYFLCNKNYDINTISDKIGFPCFVKPNKNGSSVGVSKVHTQDELQNAIDNAFRADNEVLIENAIVGREFACGIFNNGNSNIVLPITEIIPKNDFFDYQAKYTEGMSSEITPADISDHIAMTISAYTNLIYNTLNCTGLVRIDYIADDKSATFIEVNSIPGMSEKSIVPKQIAQYGLTMEKIVNQLIEEALLKK